jgi:hypothetical protein
MMKGFTAVALAAGLVAFTTSVVLADSDYDYGKQMKALIGEMPKAKVPLAQGIKIAEQGSGKAISSQYEVDPDDGYQLSVFVSEGGNVDEVIVDYATGKINSSEKLSDPDDIKDANNQLAAMAKAKTTLSDAVAAAVKATPGYEAIRVVPKLGDDGQPFAQVTLLQGSKTTKVNEKL